MLSDDKAAAQLPRVLNDCLEAPGRSDCGPERPHCSPLIPEPLPPPAGDDGHRGPAATLSSL